MSEIVVEKYDMNHEKRGVALIINIRKYKDNEQEERKWSDLDVESLRDTLKYLSKANHSAGKRITNQ